MEQKVLLFGGSGFIGTNIIKYLINKEYDVYNADISQPLDITQINIWKKCDIKKYHEVEKCIKSISPDYVIDLAARIDLNGKSIEEYSTNYEGVKNIIDCCNKELCVKKIIFTSTILVCKMGYVSKDDYDYCPDTLYGKSKVMMEDYIKSAIINPEWTILRLSSIWGPWFKEPYYKYFHMIMSERYVGINNASCKTYGYVENVAYVYEAILLAKSEKVSKKIFYVGDYEPIKINVWSNEIAKCFGVKRPITISYLIMRVMAYIGDLLKVINIKFPITSFRLHNMTTDNIIPLKNLYEVVGDMPNKREDGINKTISWMKNHINK